jgi:hypothetical protein
LSLGVSPPGFTCFNSFCNMDRVTKRDLTFIWCCAISFLVRVLGWLFRTVLLGKREVEERGFNRGSFVFFLVCLVEGNWDGTGSTLILVLHICLEQCDIFHHLRLLYRLYKLLYYYSRLGIGQGVKTAASGYKLGPLIKLYKWSDKWSMVTLRFLAPVTTVDPETLL